MHGYVRVGGIFMYASTPNSEYPRGGWDHHHPGLKKVRCYDDDQAVMHANDDVKYKIEADWTTTEGYKGDVEFRCFFVYF